MCVMFSDLINVGGRVNALEFVTVPRCGGGGGGGVRPGRAWRSDGAEADGEWAGDAPT